MEFNFEPVYLKLWRSGEFTRRIESLYSLMEKCRLCPRKCLASRMEGKTGKCKTGKYAVLSSAFAHFGEESPLVGKHGSGTIFFSNCNLLCSFCQNYEISHIGEGREVKASEIASAMISLQKKKCHNINFVTPTHVVPQIVEALGEAIKLGLKLPIVYNCGGYESVETLKLLDGIIDIYMPDFKFWDPGVAKRFTGAEDYPEVAKEALKEMHRQVGDLVIDEMGIARRGILLRHLVLPGNLAGTKQIMRFVAREISPLTYVNIMPQYHPCWESASQQDMCRRITPEEFADAIQSAIDEGITRLDERKIRFILLN